VQVGQEVMGGTIIAEVQETKTIVHKSMIPPHIEGKVVEVVPDGEYTITEPIVKVKQLDDTIIDIPLAQKWPIRIPRPVRRRHEGSVPLITGQRIIDTLFPITKGGTAAIPGGFGTGKTMMQHQIAKYSDADIIVYI